MGCSGGLKTPYEQCAFLLREYELVLRKRKDNFYIKKEGDKQKLDKNAKMYKTKIYENLEKINKNIQSEIEVRKLKQLNELFQVLLTEESEIYNNKNEDDKKNNNQIKDNKENKDKDKDKEIKIMK